MIKKILGKVSRIYHQSNLYSTIHPLKTQVYCIGTAKSGTNSISAMFQDNLKSAHEPDSEQVISVIFDFTNGRISREELKNYILKRSRRLRLRIDSSQLNYFLLDELLELYPEAKFILTIRNPYTWLDSFINHQLSRKAPTSWIRLREFRFRANELKHPLEEIILQRKELYTLDGYLSYWAAHNYKVLKAVPHDRLLVVRTDHITQRLTEIARFVGVSACMADREKSHAFKAKKKFNVLSEIDSTYLEQKVLLHCHELLDEYFPECRSAAETLPLTC